jgi:hypothetical protein
VKPAFKTEAELCAAFIAWATGHGVRCFAEWAGWDVLAVFPDGRQLGIQAKLRLNAHVILQAAPDSFGFELDRHGPDFRGVLIPKQRDIMHGIAARLGLVVFWHGYESRFHPRLIPDDDWLDWNPRQRHELPPADTDAIAGSPCPVTLTPWKIAALNVLAELETRGTITTKRMRALGVNPSRWLTACWLLPGEKRGDWTRGDRCPKFDEQHPTAYALALQKARDAVA